MSKHPSIDQAQQRAMALQQEALRLVEHAKDQLIAFEHTLATQATHVQSAAQTGRAQLQHAAAHASDQAATTLASALEAAAGQLHTVGGTGPAAQAAQRAATALEHGSAYLQPWGTQVVIRRLKRGVRSFALPLLLAAVGVFGAVALANRGKHPAY